MRTQGYIDALEAEGLTYDKDLIIDCSNDHKKNYNILSKVMKTLKPDGLFASVERLAIASYYVCQDMGIAIPRKVKIIGFSSLEIAPLLNPSLSTITQPAREMGIHAAQLLFRTLESNHPVHDHVVLKSKIIARKSTNG